MIALMDGLQQRAKRAEDATARADIASVGKLGPTAAHPLLHGTRARASCMSTREPGRGAAGEEVCRLLMEAQRRERPGGGHAQGRRAGQRQEDGPSPRHRAPRSTDPLGSSHSSQKQYSPAQSCCSSALRIAAWEAATVTAFHQWKQLNFRLPTWPCAGLRRGSVN
ncbi:unnamed protein product [Gadus morhua 'NCC']